MDCSCQHLKGALVRVAEARCPNCGPRVSYSCAGCGHIRTMPFVVPREFFEDGEPHYCTTCREPVLFVTEPA